MSERINVFAHDMGGECSGCEHSDHAVAKAENDLAKLARQQIDQLDIEAAITKLVDAGWIVMKAGSLCKYCAHPKGRHTKDGCATYETCGCRVEYKNGATVRCKSCGEEEQYPWHDQDTWYRLSEVHKFETE